MRAVTLGLQVRMAYRSTVSSWLVHPAEPALRGGSYDHIMGVWELLRTFLACLTCYLCRGNTLRAVIYSDFIITLHCSVSYSRLSLFCASPACTEVNKVFSRACSMVSDGKNVHGFLCTPQNTDSDPFIRALRPSLAPASLVQCHGASFQW